MLRIFMVNVWRGKKNYEDKHSLLSSCHCNQEQRFSGSQRVTRIVTLRVFNLSFGKENMDTLTCPECCHHPSAPDDQRSCLREHRSRPTGNCIGLEHWGHRSTGHPLQAYWVLMGPGKSSHRPGEPPQPHRSPPHTGR